MTRPSWDKYFMEITELVASRSTCLRRKVGAVIIKDKRILATGYNGAPSGLNHCLDIGCLRDKLNIPSGERQELCRGIHAEQNAIVQAAKFGISLDGGEIYVTNQPCITCSKLLINSGIKKIVYKNPYPDELAIELLEEAKIILERYEDENR
ncbi:deoxycytidylate deaminase [Haliovirga abyssi]|uniref:Cytidine deaminase n=1 Tax=Haliovirga abyssi TaxID=2996794 RepID=A0AAU9DJF1_9FUSO|nr:cytidine/deoxycytidylate deaminase family protein [Haliovirga abyssi]BDU50007.1 cytidine deaminase [Haliovirga abyssi]